MDRIRQHLDYPWFFSLNALGLMPVVCMKIREK